MPSGSPRSIHLRWLDFGYDVADYCGVDPLFGDDRRISTSCLRVLTPWHSRLFSTSCPTTLPTNIRGFKRAAKSREKREARMVHLARPVRRWWPTQQLDHRCSAATWSPAHGSGTPRPANTTFIPFSRNSLTSTGATRQSGRPCKSVMRFWLDRGVDGFRVDVVYGLAKDPASHR